MSSGCGDKIVQACEELDAALTAAVAQGADELALAPTIERGEVGARPARVVGGLQVLVPAELRGRLEARAARLAECCEQ